MRPRLQPKDLRRDIAGLRGGKQIAGHCRIGLGHAAIEIITTPLAQRLRRAADDLAISSCRRPTPARCRTLSCTASFTANAFLAICRPRSISVLPVGTLVERLTRG